MPDAPLRIRLAWAIRTTSHEVRDSSSIYFAPTRAKARALIISAIQDSWGCTWIRAAAGITSIRRAPEKDVQLPPRHALAEQIGDKLLQIVVHAYGGKSLKAGYRDHFFTNTNDADLLTLTEAGLFSKGREHPAASRDEPMAYFILTDLGRLIAAGEQAEYPND